MQPLILFSCFLLVCLFLCSLLHSVVYCLSGTLIRDRSKIRVGGGGKAGAFLFWPTSFGETLPIPGAEKMLTPQKCLHNLS